MKVSASYPPTNVPALSLRHCIHQRTTAPKIRLRRRRQPERHVLAVRILGGRVYGRHDHWTARPKGSTRQSSRIPNTSPRCHPLRLVHQASNRMRRSELISTFLLCREGQMTILSHDLDYVDLSHWVKHLRRFDVQTMPTTWTTTRSLLDQ